MAKLVQLANTLHPGLFISCPSVPSLGACLLPIYEYPFMVLSGSIFDKLNYRNLTADDINEELNNSGVLDSLNPEADGFEAPINAMHRTADSCRALVHNLHHEEHRVVEAVTAAVEEAEAEAAGFALDPLAAWAERVLTSDNVGCSEVIIPCP